MRRKYNAFIRRNYKRINLLITISFVILGILYGYIAFSIVNELKTSKFNREKSSALSVKVNQGKVLASESKSHNLGQTTAISPDKVKGTTLLLKGEASYYSRSGCLGCSENMIMANGEPLDDSQYTVALPAKFYGLLKNETVKIKNIYSGLVVWAKVTDTGGFDRLYRVADLSLATKEMLNCSDLCQVEIYR